MAGWWAMARSLLRPAGFDDLGLRRALGDRMLPLLVAAMAFLGALAVAGAVAAAAIGQHWRGGAAAAVTVQIPRPGEAAAPNAGPGAGQGAGPGAGQGAGPGAGPPPNRRERVLEVLAATPGVASARALTEAELGDLLRPWLGAGAEQLALPLPGVVAVHLADPQADLAALAARLAAAAPGTVVESHDPWVDRLAVLARSLQACAWAILALVAGVAAAVIAVATRAGLVARRDAIEIVHGLGATDGYIAGRFAGRATALAAIGGALGAAAAFPVLLFLAGLAAPLVAGVPAGIDAVPDMPLWARALAAFPTLLWVALPGLPLAACAIGFVTAQGTVRSWLRRLP
jgi:cell division transport system permease protein